MAFVIELVTIQITFAGLPLLLETVGAFVLGAAAEIDSRAVLFERVPDGFPVERVVGAMHPFLLEGRRPRDDQLVLPQDAEEAADALPLAMGGADGSAGEGLQD